MAERIVGNLSGLSPKQLRTLERLLQRRIGVDSMLTPELAYQLTHFSNESKRKLGVLVDRRGQLAWIAVGDAQRVYLPDVGRFRAGSGRLRGLRLLLSSVSGPSASGLLTQDELTDLRKLRLDVVLSVQARGDGHPGELEYAYLLPVSAQSEDSASKGDGLAVERVRLRDTGELPAAFSVFVSALEEELGRKSSRLASTDGTPAVLVHVDMGERDSASRLREMLELCRTAGVSVVHVESQRRAALEPRTVVGKGKLEQIELASLEHGAGLVVFDRELQPSQARAITDATELKVIDRSQLILDIFAQRARSHDGKLQVELAQLKYNLPKLAQKNTMMSRLTGGIGGRGPGETKLELNRRRAHERIHRLEKQLEKLGNQRLLRRQKRGSRSVPVLSLVGYTNAGKSTLLNTLTRSEVHCEDKLFATLDPTSRRLRFPRQREVVLTDTVGFIRDLPKDLVAAFKATLEELDEADVLVQVVDASDPDFELHISAVAKILEELGLSEKPVVLAFNKIDRLDAEDAQSICESHGAVGLSALDAGTTQPLLRRLDEVLLEHERWAPDEALPLGTVVRIRELAEGLEAEAGLEGEPGLEGETGLELEPGLLNPETGLLSEDVLVL